MRMQQIYIREPTEEEFLESNHEEFKERARELERKLFPSVRQMCWKLWFLYVYVCEM